MCKEYRVYRYIDKKTSEIIYVGRTDTSIEDRIKCHAGEEKFQRYDAYIEYIDLENTTAEFAAIVLFHV